jgi:DNA-binding HxlR family transcriptional regulator
LVDSAELFEAISHPVRIKILKILKKQPASFASLKRQLDIDSSGNLDYHLKKLVELITVREDGLYGLTDAGKEALLSIDAIEMWTEMEKRKIRIPRKIPKEAFSLGLLELCTTISIFWFLAIAQVPTHWGYLPPAVLLLGGSCSAFGIFTQQKWSWKAVLAKSALVISMSLFLLNYLKPGNIAPSDSMAIYYLAFVAAEAVIVILALRPQLKDFLGIRKATRISFRVVVGSLLCIFSGILLIILQSGQHLNNEVNVLSSMNDITILCGLAIVVGGVLIILRSYIPGALLSIIFGLFPRPPDALHAFDIISGYGFLGPYATLIAVVAGSLPIIGGIFALISMRKVPE